MRINSAVDGEHYYVIRSTAGEYLCIEGFGRSPWVTGPQSMPGSAQGLLRGAGYNARIALCSWGEFRSAAQWYCSMPDRVHIFNREGVFQSDWCVGLDIALTLMSTHGGFLVYMNGEYDLPFTHQVFVPPLVKVPSRPPTAWARILDDD
jgi:hypothetical protein